MLVIFYCAIFFEACTSVKSYIAMFADVNRRAAFIIFTAHAAPFLWVAYFSTTFHSSYYMFFRVLHKTACRV